MIFDDAAATAVAGRRGHSVQRDDHHTGPATTRGRDAFPAPAPPPPYASALSAFNGTDPNGTWTVPIDEFSGDSGAIAGRLSLSTLRKSQSARLIGGGALLGETLSLSGSADFRCGGGDHPG